ncbi:MAG TPA: riboflavin biosynthesis protein RibF [Fimbriimonadaceae bacterium]|nr:riboflavin biosynthesis protein RibF [Fimbriimonadaceae bacterium]HRJ34217.1 riboflavin biosynthesis protein RibF [Fimbriimonadaceae bacterium]
MRIHLGLDRWHPEWDRSVVCIGSFDGIHLGHQAVIQTAVNEASRRRCPCLVTTFDRHPLAILAPDRCPPALATLDQNLREIERFGTSVTVILPFDEAMRQTPAEIFLERMLRGHLKAEHIVVGHDFSMGKDRQGTAEWMSHRIETTIVPPFEIQGERVSSRALRDGVREGALERVTHFLGRPFALAGVVVPGQQLGRTLGYPTANLGRSFEQVVPADGVYGGIARLRQGSWRAAMSIGHRPAVGGKARTVEAFLLDYDGPEFYGAAMELEFWVRLREERDFPDLDALRDQMARDVQSTRESVLLPERRAPFHTVHPTR